MAIPNTFNTTQDFLFHQNQSSSFLDFPSRDINCTVQGNNKTFIFVVLKDDDSTDFINQKVELEEEEPLQRQQLQELQTQTQPSRYGYDVRPPANAYYVVQEIFPLHEMRNYQFALPRRTVPPVPDDDFVDTLVMQPLHSLNAT